MFDDTAQVLGVEGKPTRTGGTLYKVKLQTTQYGGIDAGTFKGELATKAHQLTGQTVTARLSKSNDGKYWNLEDIAAAGQLPPLALPAGAPVGGIPMAAQPQQSAPVAGIPMASSDSDRTKGTIIGNAISNAFNLVAALYAGAGAESLQEARDTAFALAREIYEFSAAAQGIALHTGPSTNGAEAAPIQTDGTPEGVAEAVNAVAGAAVVQPGAMVKW